MTPPRIALATAAALTATQAQAHAFGARYDLPLPLWLYLAAAGIAVAASFLGVLVFVRAGHPRSLHVDLVGPRWLGQAASALFALAGVLILAILLGAALFGPPDAIRNLATVGIWVIWWVGFLLFSALAINLWPAVDPFRTLAALSAHAAGRPWSTGSRRLPARAGWLAPAGLLTFAWVEIVSDRSEEPRALGVLIVLYLAIAVLGGLVFGRDWFRIADPLSRIFEVVGRVAPLSIRGRATLRLRPPGEGVLEAREPLCAEVALVTALIGIVLFDGLSETPAWAATLDAISESQSLRPTLLWLRDQDVDLLKLIRSFGLFTTVAAFYAAYYILIALMKTLAGGAAPAQDLDHAFVSTLLPIAVAYHLSHYASYLLIAGQLVFPAASDPFGLGWNLFGAVGRSIDITVIGARQIWWIAFAALITGHALSVLLGHRRALNVFGNPRRAALSQVALASAMVGLTMLSLWILSQPITQ
jgi:hypothetical protein